MKKLLKRLSLAAFFLLFNITLVAQPFLVKTLTTDTLNRWMITTKAIKPFSELLDSMHKTQVEALAFEALSTYEQDKRVREYLTQHQHGDKLTVIIKAQGWKSVGDYMRTSTQIGNTIAAYFQEDIIANLPPEQAQAMREKADPAIAAIAKKDLEFIRNNIVTIQKFMQDYSGVVEAQ